MKVPNSFLRATKTALAFLKISYQESCWCWDGGEGCTFIC